MVLTRLRGGQAWGSAQTPSVDGTYVVAAKPKFELLAHNVFADDSHSNASPAISNGQLLLRTDRALYCIGKK